MELDINRQQRVNDDSVRALLRREGLGWEGWAIFRSAGSDNRRLLTAPIVGLRRAAEVSPRIKPTTTGQPPNPPNHPLSPLLVSSLSNLGNRLFTDLIAGNVFEQRRGLNGGEAGHHVAADHDVRRRHRLPVLQARDEVGERGVFCLHHVALALKKGWR